jgi:hypothetical protein
MHGMAAIRSGPDPVLLYDHFFSMDLVVMSIVSCALFRRYFIWQTLCLKIFFQNIASSKTGEYIYNYIL